MHQCGLDSSEERLVSAATVDVDEYFLQWGKPHPGVPRVKVRDALARLVMGAALRPQPDVNGAAGVECPDAIQAQRVRAGEGPAVRGSLNDGRVCVRPGEHSCPHTDQGAGMNRIRAHPTVDSVLLEQCAPHDAAMQVCHG